MQVCAYNYYSLQLFISVGKIVLSLCSVLLIHLYNLCIKKHLISRVSITQQLGLDTVVSVILTILASIPKLSVNETKWLKELKQQKVYVSEIREGFLGQFNCISFSFPITADSETSVIIIVANSSVRKPKPNGWSCKVFISSFEVQQILLISPMITKTTELLAGTGWKIASSNAPVWWSSIKKKRGC